MNMIFFLFWKCPLSSPDVLTQVLFTKLGRIFFLVFIGNIHRLSSNLMEESTPYSWNKWQNFVYLKILNELRLRNDPVGLLLRLASFFFFFFFFKLLMLRKFKSNQSYPFISQSPIEFKRMKKCRSKLIFKCFLCF